MPVTYVPSMFARPIRTPLAAILTVATLLLAGCEDEEFKHDVPAGSGTLVVQNRTIDDLHIYVDGTRLHDVSDTDWRPFDLPPGLHRVVIQDEDSRNSFRDNIDIIEGVKTVIDVRDWTYSHNAYPNIDVYIQD